MSEEICIGPNSCHYCGGEYGSHAADCRRIKAKRNWLIEYEIPPLRAVYFAEIDKCTESEVRELVKKEQPLWKIRKLTPK